MRYIQLLQQICNRALLCHFSSHLTSLLRLITSAAIQAIANDTCVAQIKAFIGKEDDSVLQCLPFINLLSWTKIEKQKTNLPLEIMWILQIDILAI